MLLKCNVRDAAGAVLFLGLCSFACAGYGSHGYDYDGYFGPSVNHGDFEDYDHYRGYQWYNNGRRHKVHHRQFPLPYGVEGPTGFGPGIVPNPYIYVPSIEQQPPPPSPLPVAPRGGHHHGDHDHNHGHGHEHRHGSDHKHGHGDDHGGHGNHHHGHGYDHVNHGHGYRYGPGHKHSDCHKHGHGPDFDSSRKPEQDHFYWGSPLDITDKPMQLPGGSSVTESSSSPGSSTTMQSIPTLPVETTSTIQPIPVLPVSSVQTTPPPVVSVEPIPASTPAAVPIVPIVPLVPVTTPATVEDTTYNIDLRGEFESAAARKRLLIVST
ncbi:kininogen-1-like isoform X2 [Topomyia yanbarensis]|uniref:kininogen-1-like isoform X2 n=1 Tax=Topomyia yanbarensis TaxID=2498891 RepID=UPI00273C60C3|nr:kininogen-1-like isoform X2 [Topomyia yanbarensis]